MRCSMQAAGKFWKKSKDEGKVKKGFVYLVGTGPADLI